MCIYMFIEVEMVRRNVKTVNVEKTWKIGDDTGFSWGLTLDGNMNIDGHKVNLHDTINLQFGSLSEIKNNVVDRLFENLANLENSDKRKLSHLVYSTSKQIEKNMDLEDDLKKMEEQILKFKGKYPKIGAVFVRKVKEVKDLLLKAQGGLGREKMYLEIYRIWIIKTVRKLEKLLDKAEEQGALKENQQKLLEEYNMLLGDEFMEKMNSDGEVGLNEVFQNDWEFLLSFSEDRAPRINLNIEWTTYKITKWEKYEGWDWKSDIKNAIADKVDDDLYTEDFQNFVLRFILRPFNVWEKYDDETIKYYVKSIIKCINDDKKKIVQRIWKLYEKRKEVEIKIRSLESDISRFTGIVSWLQKYLDKMNDKKSNKQKEEESVVQDESELNPDLSNLENYLLIKYLKHLRDNPADLQTDLNISKKNIDKFLVAINYWLNIGKYSDLFGCIWKKHKNESLSEDIIKLDKKDDFINCFESIATFMWKNLDETLKGKIKNLWCLMISDCIWCEKKVNGKRVSLEDDDIIRLWQWALLKQKQQKSNEEIDKWKELSYFKRNVSRVEPLDKINIINNCFFEILWKKISNENLGNISVYWKIKDWKLVRKMLQILICELNNNQREFNDNVLDVVSNAMLSWFGVESDILDKIELYIKNLIDKIKTEDIIWEDDINIYLSLIKDSNNKLGEYSSKLEECVSVNDYNNLMLEMDCKLDDYFGNSLQEQIYIFHNDVVKQKNMLDWYSQWIIDESLNKIPEEIDDKVVRMIIIKKILETSDENFNLKDKLSYIASLKKQKEWPFKLKSFNEKHDEIIKNIFGWSGNIEDVSEDDVKNFISRFSGKYKEEIEKMQKLFPRALKLYVEKFKRDNFEVWDSNFSVVQVWILKNAVEKWNIKKVLEYLWFYFKSDLSEPEINYKITSMGWTVKSIIQQFYSDKKWCFSCEYIDDKNGTKRHNLRFVSWEYIRNMGNDKFTIWKATDEFRFDGVVKNGLFVVVNIFETKIKIQHDTRHNRYVNAQVSEQDKEIYEACTGVSWENRGKKKK